MLKKKVLESTIKSFITYVLETPIGILQAYSLQKKTTSALNYQLVNINLKFKWFQLFFYFYEKTFLNFQKVLKAIYYENEPYYWFW